MSGLVAKKSLDRWRSGALVLRDPMLGMNRGFEWIVMT